MGISFCGKNNKGRTGADIVPANITYKLILYADGEPRPLLGPEQAAQTWLPERQTNSISFFRMNDAFDWPTTTCKSAGTPQSTRRLESPIE